MIFAMQYRDLRDENKSIYDELGEIIINYDSKDITLPRFIKKHQNQSIVINISTGSASDEDVKRFIDFNDKYHNIKLRISHNDSYFEQMIKDKIPYFFNDCYCGDWDMLNSLLDAPNSNVSDIYISSSLGFDIQKVANRVHDAGKQLRLIPDIASVNSFVDIAHGITSFFVRPNDIGYYRGIVDVMEILGGPINYQAYKKQNWFGPLNEIITNLDSNIDNRAIFSVFGSARLQCQKRCGQGSSCKICKNIEQLSDTMLSMNYIFKDD